MKKRMLKTKSLQKLYVTNGIGITNARAPNTARWLYVPELLTEKVKMNRATQQENSSMAKFNELTLGSISSRRCHTLSVDEKGAVAKTKD
jgi:hypothetical protein